MTFDALCPGLTILLAGVLGWVAFVDWREFRLPDAGVLPLIPLGLAVSALKVGGWPVDESIGAVLGFGVFFGIGEIYFRARKVDGLGIGDAKLLSAAGAWLGATALPLVVLCAALPALGVAFALRSKRIAFGPYLAAAFFAIWLWSGR